jgi:type I restriction enzyme, S subunit
MTFENLSELTTYLQRGISPKYEEIGIPVINQKCIRNGQLKREGVKFHSNQNNVSPEKYLVENDILVNSTGVGTLGRVARVGGTHGELVADSHVTIVRPNTELVDPLFLFYAMRLSEPTIVSLASGSTGQTELSRFALGALEIPKLEKSAQRFIATTFSAIDEKILVNEALSQTLENIAMSFFKSWFIDFDPVKAKMAGEKPVGIDDKTASLFPDTFADSEIGSIPSGWENSTVEKFCPFVYGKSLPAGIRVAGGVPVYGSNGIVGSHNAPLVRRPTVVIGRKGTIGTVHLELFPSWIIDTGFYTNTAKDDDVYLAYLTLKGLGLDSMNSDAAVPGLNRDNAHRLPFTIATSLVREAFSQVVKPLFELKHQLMIQNSTLSQVRDSIMPRLISGELPIPEEMLAS